MAERRPFAAIFSAVVLVLLWLGAALFLAVVVAPAAFAVLPSRTLAGDMIGRILPVLFVAGMLIGLVVIALELSGSRNRHWLARCAGALLLSGACGVAQLGIAPRIGQVKAVAAGAIDTLIAESARNEFGRLHMMSVAWLAVAILAAISLVLFASLGLRSAEKNTEN